MKKTLLAFMVLILLLSSAGWAERLKDIAFVEGVRDNQLVGFGLVVGLNGTGDKGKATLQGIANMLSRMGLRVDPKDIKAKNVAAVMVTATMPPFPRPGLKLDATVSAIGDAKNLQGGTLLMTPLKGPDGRVYAIAQGPVSIGGFQAGGGGTGVQKNHPTVGRVPEGAIVERDVFFDLNSRKELKLILKEPDFTVATNTMRTINSLLKGEYAKATDPSTVLLTVPEDYLGRAVELMRLIENVNIPTDSPARVVINEKTGTVVIGSNVRISPVAIAHGGLTIEITTNYAVSQPEPFSQGKTQVVPQTEVNAKEKEAHLIEVSGTTLGEVVRALNSMGVTPRDLIAILQALKASGALKAELEIL
ncbi:MAG: flagellar basal body P-ring protein FlgI [Nitrospirae bacterium]|nr:MAG: flagellar basal body P-ring protein FlgI [Nitrospirota bacterium]